MYIKYQGRLNSRTIAICMWSFVAFLGLTELPLALDLALAAVLLSIVLLMPAPAGKKSLRRRLWMAFQNLTGHRIVTTPMGAADLGFEAAHYNRWWRFVTISFYRWDDSITPPRTYFFAGNLRLQLQEFLDVFGK